jgi:hypothetical protein
MAGRARRYARDEVRLLAELLRSSWPGLWSGAGDRLPITRFENKELRVVVWMSELDEAWRPAKDGWRGVMVSPRFDREITRRRVEKVLRQQARRLVTLRGR